MSQFDANAFAVASYFTPTAADITAAAVAFPFDVELVSVTLVPSVPGTATANAANVKINGSLAFSTGARPTGAIATATPVSAKPDLVTTVTAGQVVLPTFVTVGTSVGATSFVLWFRKK